VPSHCRDEFIPNMGTHFAYPVGPTEQVERSQRGHNRVIRLPTTRFSAETTLRKTPKRLSKCTAESINLVRAESAIRIGLDLMSQTKLGTIGKVGPMSGNESGTFFVKE
jgi:hypothetical protein